MKKLLSVLPSTLQGGFRGGLLFLALLVTTALWAYDFKSGDLYYNITSDSTVEVTQGGCSGEVIIPETVTYNGITYSVTRIGERAFYACSLTSVTIPASVISIEEYSFYESKYIKTLYLKSTTPPILNGGKIFITSRPTCYIPCGTLDTYKASKWANLMSQFVEECEEEDSTNIITYTSSDGKVVQPYKTDVFGANIVSNEYKDGQGVITFDGPVTNIGDRAFYKCTSLTSITIPNSVTSIGLRAFSYCSSLASITIPNSVTSIGDDAFSYCSSLTSVTIPESVTSIGPLAFNGCSSLPIENNLRYADTYLVGAVDRTLSTYSIKKGTKWIGGYAFFNCTSLTSVTIPESVTSIGSWAFENCSSLTSITIPNSVTSIGDLAFSDCSSLTSITIPDNVRTIGGVPFYGCTRLTSVWIGKNLTSIEFYACPSLVSIVVSSENEVLDSRDNCNAVINTATNTLIAGCRATVIPNSVTTIGGSAFEQCSSLTSITIPNSVTNVGERAFMDCSILTSVTIPESVTNIGEGAFYGTSIDYVYVKATTPPMLNIGKYSVFSTSPTCYIPCGTLDAYKASKWSSQVSQFVEECEEEDNTPTDLENTDIQYPISDTRKLLRDNQLYIYHNGSTYTIMGAEIQ